MGEDDRQLEETLSGARTGDGARTHEVRRALDGDRDAFDGLVRRHSAEIYPVVMRVLGDRNQADDVIQESTLLAWTRRSQVHSPESFSSWFSTICRHEALRTLRERRTARQRSVSLESASPERSFEGAPTDDLAIAESAARWLELAETLLRPRAFAALLLRYRERSFEEIGGLLDCSAANARSLFRRARERLWAHVLTRGAELIGGDDAIREAYLEAEPQLSRAERRAFESRVFEALDLGRENDFLSACGKVARHVRP
ncbi:MAG: RNA polymerase sigma factor [Planctomycetes bacterium]|nr:RNA polymerase sigma factor [Planctomycetota bacterium]